MNDGKCNLYGKIKILNRKMMTFIFTLADFFVFLQKKKAKAKKRFSLSSA